LAPPYYSQRAVFASPLSGFFIVVSVAECYLRQGYVSSTRH